MAPPAFDPAHLPAPLAVDQGESSWICAELVGTGERGPRHLGLLAWLHRTGPRLTRFDSGPGLLDKNQLPALVRELVPSWLPILTPVKIRADDRPLLMVVLFDLDRPESPPIRVEQEIEHPDFDASTFSGKSADLSLNAERDCLRIGARTRRFELSFEARPEKLAVGFGPGGSELLRHGEIEIGYLQRPRLSFRGEVTLDGERIRDVTGLGAHDRHWRWSSHADLAWLWLHLRLDGEREVNCYVLRDAKTHAEIGRGACCIVTDGTVEAIGRFDLVATREGEYRFAAPALEIDVRFTHVMKHPYVALGAFGAAIEGGICEGPIRVLESASASGIAGWLEVFDATTCRVT